MLLKTFSRTREVNDVLMSFNTIHKHIHTKSILTAKAPFTAKNDSGNIAFNDQAKQKGKLLKNLNDHYNLNLSTGEKVNPQTVFYLFL